MGRLALWGVFEFVGSIKTTLVILNNYLSKIFTRHVLLCCIRELVKDVLRIVNRWFDYRQLMSKSTLLIINLQLFSFTCGWFGGIRLYMESLKNCCVFRNWSADDISFSWIVSFLTLSSCTRFCILFLFIYFTHWRWHSIRKLINIKREKEREKRNGRK